MSKEYTVWCSLAGYASTVTGVNSPEEAALALARRFDQGAENEPYVGGGPFKISVVSYENDALIARNDVHINRRNGDLEVSAVTSQGIE